MIIIDTKEQAQAFAIYRHGIKTDWEAAYHDIAEVVGIPSNQVKRICLSRGWWFEAPDEMLPGVDHQIIDPRKSLLDMLDKNGC